MLIVRRSVFVDREKLPFADRSRLPPRHASAFERNVPAFTRLSRHANFFNLPPFAWRFDADPGRPGWSVGLFGSSGVRDGFGVGFLALVHYLTGSCCRLILRDGHCPRNQPSPVSIMNCRLTSSGSADRTIAIMMLTAHVFASFAAASTSAYVAMYFQPAESILCSVNL